MKRLSRVDQFRASLWIITAHLLTPVIRLIGKIHAPYSEKKAIQDYHRMVKIMKPLDLILSNTWGHLSNALNPYYWKHAIIYIGKENGIPMIVEAIGQGVIKRPLVECLAEKDEVAVLRYRDPKPKTEKAIRWLLRQCGKDYDFSFDLWSNHKFQNFYCSELAYYTHKHAYRKYQMELRETFGVPTITPSDFFNARKKYLLLLRTREES